jgi:cytoskeleton protein RodZ
MTEPEPTSAAADPVGVASAGALLRAAREKQGLHLAALAAALKVAPRKLELLETDRYDELPDATFTRALALSVCRVLKIDATPVLVRLPQSTEHGLEQVARGLNQPFRDRIARHEPGEWQRLFSLPAIGALLLLVAAAVVYLMPERPIALPALAAFWPGASAPAAPAASAVVAVAASEPIAEAASAVALDVPASAASTPSALNETVFSAPPAGSADSATAAPLALRAIGSSWVEVRDRDGRVLLSRTLNTGETVGVDGAMPLKVVIGNADVTQLSFRGQPVALAAVTKDNVARLELK